MSKSRDIADSAATINFIDDLTSAAQSQIDAKAPTVSPSFTGGAAVTGSLIATSYNETYVAVVGHDVDCQAGNFFSSGVYGNTTFTFSNPPPSGTAFGFVLQLIASLPSTITWPASVKWAGGTAPDAPAQGETDILCFLTRDGGTTWYGFLGGDAVA